MSKIKEKNIDKKEENLQKKSSRDMNTIIGGIVFGVIFSVISFMLYKKIGEHIVGLIITVAIACIAFMCYMVAGSGYFDYRQSIKNEKLEEDAREEEKEFSQIELEQNALRAEKLFRMNQKELKRYYDMNIEQTRYLSKLGISMIIVGGLIVIISLILYVYSDLDNLFLIAGNFSGIIIDFIGAVFIKMYNKNIEASVKFHEKYSESNNLLLANSIANKIKEENLREETLSEMAKSIVKLK